MMDEAPASPRGAAIYYWGGDWGREDDNDAYRDAFGGEAGGGGKKNQGVAVGPDEWVDAKNDSADYYADLHESTFRKRSFFEHRHRPAAVVRFHLSLMDDGDDDHWMYAPDLSAARSSKPVEEELEEKEEEVARPLSIPELPFVDDDKKSDFVDPTNVEEDDFESIPVIDLSTPREVYARQIGDACRDVGFFYIVNHGVDRKVMEDVMDKSERFFGMNLESKLAVSSSGGGGSRVNGKEGEKKKKKGYRGYFEIGGEDLDKKDGTRDLAAEEGGVSDNVGETKNGRKHAGDFKEGFDCGLESGGDNSNNDYARIKFFGRNIWPDESTDLSVAGFRETLMKYQAELIGLSDKLLLALGRSLNDNPNGGDDEVAEDYFVRRSRDPMCTLRLLHYPPAEKSDGASQGCGAHTDYGCFTILQQDSVGGLQVRNRHGRWINARPLSGSFVINVGDMLSHWTNGEYASTVHRVISPSTSVDRYSVPFFFNPDHDALVRPLRGGGDGREGGGAKTALEILMMRYEGTF